MAHVHIRLKCGVSELHDSTSPAAACMNGLILIRLIAVDYYFS